MQFTLCKVNQIVTYLVDKYKNLPSKEDGRFAGSKKLKGKVFCPAGSLVEFSVLPPEPTAVTSFIGRTHRNMNNFFGNHILLYLFTCFLFKITTAQVAYLLNARLN